MLSAECIGPSHPLSGAFEQLALGDAHEFRCDFLPRQTVPKACFLPLRARCALQKQISSGAALGSPGERDLVGEWRGRDAGDMAVIRPLADLLVNGEHDCAVLHLAGKDG